jgi:uncharacterized protein (TIGR02246 family)
MSVEARQNTEAQIRDMVSEWVKAVRAKDLNGSTSDYASDVVLFDVVNPLQHVGSDAARKRAQEWFSSFESPIGYEIRDLKVTAGDDVAVCHSLNHVSGTTTQGKEIDMWWRATVCLRKSDGKWLVTHEHSSVQFDVESGRASTDLKP